MEKAGVGIFNPLLSSRLGFMPLRRREIARHLDFLGKEGQRQSIV